MNFSLDLQTILRNLRPIVPAGSRAYENQPGAAAFRTAVNVFTAVLLLTCLGGIVGMERRTALLVVLLLASFAAAYSNCVVLSAPRFQQLASLAVVFFVWVLLVVMLPVSLYLVFSMFFLFMRVLPGAWGIVGVLVANAVVIGSQWGHFTMGSVMGPTVSAMVCVGIHLTFLALWRASADREKVINELIETRQQLAETERAAGVTAERQRIAHEIHDTLAQGLSSIQMLLRVAESEVEKTGLSEEEKQGPLNHMELARKTAADNLQEARAMIAALQPAALSKTSLEGAFHRVAENIVGPEVTIEVEGEERQLPMRTEAALLRIGQGALGNVSKHANATRCHVTLTYADDEVRLDVVDNGDGFDPKEIDERPAGLGHIGLNAMRQRAKEQGGILVVESAPGEGTALSISIPIDNHQANAAPSYAAQVNTAEQGK